MSDIENVDRRKSTGSFATLRRFVRARASQEQCEVCGVVLLHDHSHLFDPFKRQLICACEQCTISVGDQAATQYRRVPRRAHFLPDFRLSDAQWDDLLIPVGMAFFFYSTPAQRVIALYPSPAGATESLLSLESWRELIDENPGLRKMQPDVEALLVNRVKDAREHYLAPIDKCYELVGLIRSMWKGLSGGSEVWEAIASFFAGLKQQSETSQESTHA